MNIFRRRPRLPAELRPPLESGERVLAWSPVGEGQAPVFSPVKGGGGVVGRAVLVATNLGLWVPDGPGLPAAEHPGLTTMKSLGWHEIHKAAWSGRELRITPAEVAEVRADYAVLIDAPVLTYLLLEPGDLPDQVRTRVTRSVAYTEHYALPAGGVRVVGRRVSGVDGLSWAVRYDAGTPVDAEPVVQLTQELVAAAQGATAPPD